MAEPCTQHWSRRHATPADGPRQHKALRSHRHLPLKVTGFTHIENEVMYPRVLQLLPQLEKDILESYEEHHVADVIAMELYAMTPQDERFEAKTTVLIKNVTHHMDEEEQDWFPQVRDELGRKQLQQLGQELIEARQDAPHQSAQPSAPLKKTIDAVLS